MTLVWLPAQALDGDLRAALGQLPDQVVLRALPADEDGAGSAPAGAGEVEFLVLPTGLRDRLGQLLPDLPRLRVVQTLSAGVDWVPPLPEQVTLCNASGVHDGPVAEWVLGALLADAKRLPYYLDRQRAGEWDEDGNLAAKPGGAGGGDLAELTVLVVGAGSIGRALTARLAAFGTRVLAVARRTRPEEQVADLAALPELVPQADVVVLLAPATDATHGLVDAAFLDRMRPGALLVNAARGSLVDTEALLAALRAGRVRAALDVTDPEPLPAGHPLWSAPGVLITPHVAGSTPYWLPRSYRLVGDQLRRYAAGEPLANVRDAGY